MVYMLIVVFLLPVISIQFICLEMARYTGPKSRIARKFGEGIFGADKVLSKKNYPPGQQRFIYLRQSSVLLLKLG